MITENKIRMLPMFSPQATDLLNQLLTQDVSKDILKLIFAAQETIGIWQKGNCKLEKSPIFLSY
jgi:hypothetical protein